MEKKKIGFYGYPPEAVIADYKNQGYEFIDLDIDFQAPDSGLLPHTTCQIIKNIVDNAFYYRNELELIIATVGEDKCDNGRFTSKLLSENGFKLLNTTNTNMKRRPTPISDSDLPLLKKIDFIMDGVVIHQQPLPDYKKLENPRFGFWGVPPNDFSILELFPKETALLGWTRCVEAGTPGDLELEMFVPQGIKTVFFTQSFCAKGMLAKHLAEKHRGLFIDLEKYATHSIIAKIEAFLRLS